jgi:hypothetical protein
MLRTSMAERSVAMALLSSPMGVLPLSFIEPDFTSLTI